uniref:Uncharacterized protein n=1 Tax=Macrostomum lignano TaxID=282301 RepID=A0A1I8HMT3_9PLAT
MNQQLTQRHQLVSTLPPIEPATEAIVNGSGTPALETSTPASETGTPAPETGTPAPETGTPAPTRDWHSITRDCHRSYSRDTRTDYASYSNDK